MPSLPSHGSLRDSASFSSPPPTPTSASSLLVFSSRLPSPSTATTLARAISSFKVSFPCSLVLTRSASTDLPPWRFAETFDNKNSNSVYWSPKGRHVLIATLGSNSKFDIDFWDLDLDREEKATDNDPGAGIRLITTVEHYGLTDIEWDPSGRYVATSASTWMSSVRNRSLFGCSISIADPRLCFFAQMESGYAIWDFKGVELQKHTLDKFKQFLWRPRPPTLLTRDDQKKIRKNLREYSRQFEEQDQLEASNVSSELIALRKRLIEEWNAWRRVAKEDIERRRVELGRSKKAALQRSEEAENADEVVEEWVEEVVSEVIEVVA